VNFLTLFTDYTSDFVIFIKFHILNTKVYFKASTSSLSTLNSVFILVILAYSFYINLYQLVISGLEQLHHEMNSKLYTEKQINQIIFRLIHLKHQSI